ncbi:cytochrome P450, variant [Tothia fuscella]|uniref:Cytochrome P450, variant n=1 Tax=Tothia fuscella TaxID=1048955 RepID=A0A9P4NZQ5_9PEZI|nr:cytochrome P450, variant [Tothia fuscella]
MGLKDVVQRVPTQALWGGLLALWFLYLICLAVYRLNLSPLAKFPGPKLAGLTKWYEFYYEVVKRGQYQFLINDMHKKYESGVMAFRTADRHSKCPIVRVTPFELHVDESTFWDELYNKHPKSRKYDWMNGRFGNETSIFTTCDPTLHRLRRAPLNPMFSRRSIMAQEPTVQEKSNYLCDRLVEYMEKDKFINVARMWSSFAGDVITRYSFGFDDNHLGSEDFKACFHDAFLALSEFGHLSLQYPSLGTLMAALPDSISGAMDRELAKLLKLQRDFRTTIRRIKSDMSDPKKQPEHPTVFHEILRADLPPSEKSEVHLGHEAQTVIGAGLSTTAWAFTNATFYVLHKPEVLAKLREELWAAIPDINAADAFSYPKLEQLPYLKGVYREGIRLSHGVSARNPRLIPYPIEFNEWTIPAHTPVSMTIMNVTFDPEIFPEPNEFRPERWMNNPRAPDGQSLEQYWVNFGKGTRMCLGINLAYMELTLGLAHLFRRFKLELYETDKSDVILAHDFMLPAPKSDSKGVRVKVVGVEK